MRLLNNMKNYLQEKNSINVPDGFFIRPKTLAIFDDIKNEITLINPYWYQKNQNHEKAYEFIVNNLKKLIKTINTPLKYKKRKSINKFIKPKSNIKKNTFLEMVKKQNNIFMKEIFSR